jgi:hypothetical protein
MNMIDKDSVLVQAGASALFTCVTGIPAGAGTICTGDTIQGTPVISQLDVHDLELGKKHRFFFQGAQMGTASTGTCPSSWRRGLKAGSASY